MTGADTVLRVRGGRPLAGKICIGGSKNASLPILAACLLTPHLVTLTNVAEVTDTAVMLAILERLGATVEKREEGAAAIRADAVDSDVPIDLAGRMRGSIVLLGPLLARTGRVRLPRPGGDAIGVRRVEQHINGLRRMGAVVDETESEIIASVPAGRLRGARVVLDMPTVTGTENIMLAAVTAAGRTEILNAAREPHVQDLARFLNQLGANVVGAGISDEIVIEGVEELGGAVHPVTADYLEAGTYAMAVAATGGDVTLECSPPADLDVPLLKLQQAGVDIEVVGDALRIHRDSTDALVAVDLTTWVHPGFATDLQPQYMALMTQATGRAIISEFLFENRFQHVGELIRMGARVRQLNGRMAEVEGPAALHGAEVSVPDIRSGAALVIAALCAEGESIIHQPWHVDRGYPDLVGKLGELGADIRRETATASRPASPGHEE
jgi:UDP-N-acetylglucosamine 1-carboxyvinyltransferase